MAEEITIGEILEKKRAAEREQTQLDLQTKIDNYRRIIEAELDPDYVNPHKVAGRSCLDDPFLLSLVEFLVAEEAVAIFGTEPFIAVEGFEDSDIPGAKKMSNLLRYQFYEDVTQYTIVGWIIGAQAYPASVVKIGWDFNDESWKLELCPLETIYFSPASTGPLNKMIPWTIHESWIHIDDLEAAKDARGKPLYQNLAKVRKKMAGGKRPTKLTATGEEYEKHTTEELKNMVHVLDYWTDDKNAAIANEEIFIIEERENPYEHNRKPFIVMNDWPKLFSPYGVSTIEKCYDTYREGITRKNQRIDNIHQGINFGWYINEGAGVDEDAIVEWDRGKIVRGNAPPGEAVMPLSPNMQATSLAYKEGEEVRRSLQDATHAYAYARGETPIRKETATGLSQLVAAASIVFRFKIMMKENTAIKELAAMAGALNQQYLPDEKIIRILGDEINEGGQMMWRTGQHVAISRKDIQGRFDYIAKGSAVDPEIGKPLKRAHMLQMLQQLVPLMLQGGLPPQFLLDYVMLLMEQFEVPEASALAKKYKKVSEQQQAMMQMMNQLQQMMAMGGGRGMPMQMPGGVPTPAQAGPEMATPGAQMKAEAGRSLSP